MVVRKPINMATMLDWHANRSKQTVFHLDRPFDIDPTAGVLFNGPQAASLAHEAANWWYAAGARSGDHVAVVKDNHFDIQLLIAAAARVGAIPAALSALLESQVLADMLRKLAPSVTFTSPSVLARAAESGVDLGSVAGRLVIVGELEDMHAAKAALSLNELRGSPAAPLRLRANDEPMLVCHTSGTTGPPKLVVHTAESLHAANRLDCLPVPVLASRPSDVFATAISFVHARATGTFSAQLSHAPSKLVVVSRFDEEHVARVLSQHTPTILEAVPNLFLRWQALTRTNPGAFSQVRLYFNTFDLIHPATVRAYLAASERRVPLWLQGWGQSETGPITAAAYTRSRVGRSAARRAVTSDVGWTVPTFSAVKVVDQTSGRRLAPYRRGILMSRTHGRCVDYLGESPRHYEKQDGKWWNTGDMGYRDLFGRVRLVDREVDMIPGGSGIDIESLLLDRLPDATEVTVLGVPGRLPVPILCLRSNTLDAEAWAAATVSLPPLEDPILVPWEDVPRTGTWKVRRGELRRAVLHTEQTFGTGRWT